MAPPPGAVPPTLAPSVEEAYRRKCAQLKQRMNEVEESNDAARARLVRIQRGVEKLRLERAFLLEQLAKRTSTNVEDSEGSPSPPPTPQEKPLRVKRGHRKASFLLEENAANPFIHQGPVTHSPSSDAFSHTPAEQNPPLLPKMRVLPHPTNGHTTPSTGATLIKDVPKGPRNVFDVYCKEMKPVLMTQRQGNSLGIDEALAEGFHKLTPEEHAHYAQLFNDFKWPEPQVVEERSLENEQSIQAVPGALDPIMDGEDTEMKDEPDDAGPHVAEAAGFTAVNRG